MTVRKIMTEKLGEKRAGEVFEKINEGCKNVKGGDELKKHVRSVLTEAGIGEPLDITDAFFATPSSPA